jgi:hypothetical protein
MANTNLLTIFIALTAVAVLIQTGILVGLYLVTTKLSRQADHAMDVTRKNLMEPLQATVDNLQNVTARIAEFSSTSHEQLRRLEHWWKRRAA